ncbi:hypothetical protein ACVU7I_18970, partial [Patulibacter sp. S7RM1-6]
MNARPGLAEVLAATAPSDDGASPIAHLLEVQFWLMGRDVERPDGNLLLRLGFVREPVPPGRKGSSRYRRREPDGGVLLWTCGLLLDARGVRCLLVRGHPPAVASVERTPDIYGTAEVLALLQRSPASPPAATTRALRWLADYEAAVLRAAGVGHRTP